ncbi:VC0807 family protein [Sphaerisporangium perillae]|uniref:VC0807 family protein n=1 Tax=Sphaerisporangium perillae TaxID=2935860 RepID=UPI0020106F27|nr:VC0807 family protein [Sphaerisporangium perillae]
MTASTLALPSSAPHPVLPRIPDLIRHAAPRVLEGMILPVAVFYAGLLVAGVNGGLAMAVTWVYGGVALRLIRRQKVPGTVLLAMLAITVRAALALVTGDVVIYFLQPTLGVYCASLAFLTTAAAPRPLIQRVTTDLVPLPDHLVHHPRMRRFFVHLSLLWGTVQFVNGSLSLWLLFSESIETYLIVRTAAVAVLMVFAALASLLAFKRALRLVQAAHRH